MPACPLGTYAYAIQAGDTLPLIAQRFHTSAQAIASANPALRRSNLRAGQIICIPKAGGPQQTAAQTPPRSISPKELTLNNQMRLLWEQHVYWTRMTILGIIFGSPDTDATVARLLRNAKDIEAAFKPFYGEEASAKLAALFTDHLTIAAELVRAAKAGDSAKAADAEKRWYANADQIAAFLASINPYWSAQEWKKLLYDHLAMTKAEAVSILNRKYAESIAIFDKIEKEALVMADVMTQGIVRQFPQSFK